MRLVLERRAERSTAVAVASPLIAIALTLATMAIPFAALGKRSFMVGHPGRIVRLGVPQQQQRAVATGHANNGRACRCISPDLSAPGPTLAMPTETQDGQ